VNWGNPSDWQGFWWVVSGQPYRALAFGLPAESLAGRVQAWAGLALAQFGVMGLAAGFFGLVYGRAGLGAKLATGWAMAVFTVFAIGYGTADSYAYLAPAFLAFAMWLGLGVATILAGLPRRLAGLQPALATAALVLVLANAGGHLPRVDASGDMRAETFGRAALAQAPPEGLIFTQGDRDTFSLWYFHLAAGLRPDVAIVVEPMLVFDWYRANLRATYAGLRVPEGQPAGWREALVAANAGRPVCDTRLDAPEPLACGSQP
jgi:hypothetical protein